MPCGCLIGDWVGLRVFAAWNDCGLECVKVAGLGSVLGIKPAGERHFKGFLRLRKALHCSE
jgi:hypothetical protein